MTKANVETNSAISYFYKHIVPIEFTFIKDSKEEKYIVTAFVISVRNKWMLITAGHCLRKVERYLSNGYQLIQTFLRDSYGLNVKHDHPIPFDYENAPKIVEFERSGVDFGVIALHKHYTSLLIKNNIVPFSEDYWKRGIPEHATYKLLGIPSANMQSNQDEIIIAAFLASVQPLTEKPEGFANVNIPCFYGRIPDAIGFESIEGMSGGPILATYYTEEDKLAYSVVAVQSLWLPSKREILAPKISYVTEKLEALLN